MNQCMGFLVFLVFTASSFNPVHAEDEVKQCYVCDYDGANSESPGDEDCLDESKLENFKRDCPGEKAACYKTWQRLLTNVDGDSVETLSRSCIQNPEEGFFIEPSNVCYQAELIFPKETAQCLCTDNLCNGSQSIKETSYGIILTLTLATLGFFRT